MNLASRRFRSRHSRLTAFIATCGDMEILFPITFGQRKLGQMTSFVLLRMRNCGLHGTEEERWLILGMDHDQEEPLNLARNGEKLVKAMRRDNLSTWFLGGYALLIRESVRNFQKLNQIWKRLRQHDRRKETASAAKKSMIELQFELPSFHDIFDELKNSLRSGSKLRPR